MNELRHRRRWTGRRLSPCYVKYMIPHKRVDYIIINGECEPYITTDHRIMLENGEECLIGVQALLIASGAPEARIGIEANKPDALNIYNDLPRNILILKF